MTGNYLRKEAQSVNLFGLDIPNGYLLSCFTKKNLIFSQGKK
jgi:hypothetical protein